jgi:hypothetical protein
VFDFGEVISEHKFDPAKPRKMDESDTGIRDDSDDVSCMRLARDTISGVDVRIQAVFLAKPSEAVIDSVFSAIV